MKLSERMAAQIEALENNTARSRRATAEVFATAAELMQDQDVLLQTQSLPAQPSFNLPSNVLAGKAWTVPQMKKTFSNFKEAQCHYKNLYNVRANGWANLTNKVNLIEASLFYLATHSARSHSVIED
ncbi:hypothetical protein GS597_19635 [Synechococcales cyanobacterium C]|uniref:Uncharacterized protein n=1 Tax=Petrachloros mirabilis ULC683 TaxID=2781853 RepID=A0A8K2A2V3_9CYAN|nr:hypothetical protein [Petrachloros mirabilis]NCJ08677.1 hypothetical protein [Petrachloros mirabilis ULC683]